MDNQELSLLTLTNIEHFKLKSCMNVLKYLQQATLELQDEKLTLLESRCILDTIIELFPLAEKVIGRTASIVKYPDFENAVVKIVSHEEKHLTVAEAESVTKLLKSGLDKNNSVTTMDSEINSNHLKNIINNCKRLRTSGATLAEASAYIDACFICPTSNIVERLFSRSKLTLASLRTRMTPENLENVVFLLYNETLWDVFTLGQL